MFYLKVFEELNKARVPYAVVGGLAVNLHGVVRGTVDLDTALNFSLKSFQAAEDIFKKVGLQPRIPITGEEVYNFRLEYLQKRNLIAWSFVNPNRPIEVVDVILSHDQSKMKVVTKSIGKLKIPVASIPDLIEMKRQSGRPQDLEDIKALKEISK